MTFFLSPHFTIPEFCVSERAEREGIRNVPTAEIIQNMMKLAAALEGIRSKLNDKPIIITSGYRSPELNAATPGSAGNSAHMTGFAADFICPAFGHPRDICRALRYTVPYDQLIYEFSWVHFGIAEKLSNYRTMAMTKDKNGFVGGIV